MKRRPFYLVLLLLLSCNEASQNNNESQEAENSIINNNKQIEQWYKDKKADSLIIHMADKVIQLPPNRSPLIGRDSVKKYWEQLFQFGNIDFSIRTQEVKANGTLAVELGKYSFKFNPNPNSPIPVIVDSGNYVCCWQKIDGSWKLVWDAPVSTVPIH